MKMTGLGQDVRYAVRTLFRRRGFTAAALVSIALGIAASTVLFSVVYGVVLNPFPYRDPWGIVTVRLQNRKPPQARQSFSGEESRALGASPIFTETMLCGFEQFLWTGEGDPDSVRGVLMSGSAFHFLGVEPLLGRAIGPADAPQGRDPEPVAVLSYARWQRRFGGNPNVLGWKILLNDKPYTIIGVMPPRFTWYGRDSVWLPLPPEGKQPKVYQFRGRLRPDVSVENAGDQLHAIVQKLAEERPNAYPREGFKTVVVSMKDFNVASGNLRKSLVPLLVTVGLLLLIACSNVANLLLARATARRKEITVRAAIGASRGRLIRQLLTESLLLALGGACAGALCARLALHSTVALIPSFNLPDEAVISLNGPVLAFCAAVSVFTGVLFGLAPALQASRVDLQQSLRDAGRGQSDTAIGSRMRGALVVLELTLSVVLLLSAAFTLRSFIAVETADLGFQPQHVLLAPVSLPPARYQTADRRNRFLDDAVDRIANVPQVRAVSSSVGAAPGIFLNAAIRGDDLLSTDQKIGVAFVSPDFYKVFSIPLREGRFATADEVRHSDRVAVLNESAVKQFWHAGYQPLGRHVSLTLAAPGSASGPDMALTIIGVAGDTRNDGLTNPPRPAIFLPSSLAWQPFRTIEIQTFGAPEAVASSVRLAIHDLDRALPMVEPVTVDSVLDFERVGPRFMSMLFSVFAGVGLILAACGTYGVISYSVSRRTYEFGIRMALGAQRSDILWNVIWGGMRLAIFGVLLGLASSFVVVRLYRDYINQSTYLRNFNPDDPVPIVAVSLGLLLVALVASYLPARRAASGDPARSLRYE